LATADLDNRDFIVSLERWLNSQGHGVVANLTACCCCCQGRRDSQSSTSLANHRFQDRLPSLRFVYLIDPLSTSLPPHSLPLHPCSSLAVTNYYSHRLREGRSPSSTHQRVNMSYECETCIRSFSSKEAAEQHMNALNHWDDEDHTCNTCDKTFASEESVDQHMDALNHWGESEDEDEFACDRCDRTFTSWDGCKQHMTALNHWYTDKCDTCDRRFVNKQAAEQHMDALEHRSSPYCRSCERYFQHPSDLFQHMNSPIHMRADPIHPASPPPVRSAPVSRPAPVSVPAPPAAVQSSTLPATNSYRTSHLVSAISTAPTRPVIATPPLTPAPAVVTPQPASLVLFNTQLAKPCTICIPFKAFVEKELGSSTECRYQSITFMRPHQAFSFEELRLSDYKAGCKPGNSSTGAVARAIYRDQSTQTDISHSPASSVYISAASSRAATPDLNATNPENGTTKVRDSTNENLTFSLSEIKYQQTEPVPRSGVLSCPFCYMGFNAIWEVAEHLESSSCQQRPDLNRSRIHRHQCQQDPDGIMTVQISDCVTGTQLYRCPNKICKGSYMSSFAELLAHLESESCSFIRREDLWKDISECKNLWKDMDDC
jgi:hypothetical protein